MKTDEPSDVLVLATGSNALAPAKAVCPSDVGGGDDRPVVTELLAPPSADLSQDQSAADDEHIESDDYAAMTLDELGRAISTLHQNATYFAKTSLQVAASSVQKAVTAGAALLAAKSKVKHGEWGPWLQQHVPSLSQDTANRYMKLAKQITHVRNFDEKLSLRQAFLLAGVVKEPLKGEAKRACKPPLEADTAMAPTDIVSRFRSLRVFLDTTTPRLRTVVLPDSDADELAVEVGQIVGHLRDLLQHLEKATALLPARPKAMLALPAPATAPTTAPTTPKPTAKPKAKKSKASGKAKRAAEAARTAKAVHAGRESHAAFIAVAKAAAAELAAKQNAPTATDRVVEGTSKPATK